MTTRFDTPGLQYRDIASDEILGGLNPGQMFFYATGTTTLQTTYKDPDLTVANTNPVILNPDGTLPNVWLQELVYNVVLKNASAVEQFARDPIDATTPDEDWRVEGGYSLGDKVKASDNNWYISLVDNNIGNDPTSSPDEWTRYRIVRVYSAVETYEEGAIVEYTDNFIYVSKTDSNIGNDPSSDLTNWQTCVDTSSLTSSAFAGVENFGTSTGNQAITGVGFQPSMVLVFSVASDGSNYVSFSIGAGPGQTSTSSISTTGVCLFTHIDYSIATVASSNGLSSTLLWNCDDRGSTGKDNNGQLVSLDADGFTLDPVVADQDTLIFYAAFP